MVISTRSLEIKGLVNGSRKILRLRLEPREELEGPCEYYRIVAESFDPEEGIFRLGVERVPEEELKRLASAMGEAFNDMISKMAETLGIYPFIAKCGDKLGVPVVKNSKLVVLRLYLWYLK